ncbi:MAG: hypothetical protein AVDCRST_MAG11-2959, partial [uncultured Gemmatimonadaceae bacterium]
GADERSRTHHRPTADSTCSATRRRNQRTCGRRLHPRRAREDDAFGCAAL